MKGRVLIVLLCLTLAMGGLAGCSTTPPPKEETKEESSAVEKEENNETAKGDVLLPSEGKLKTGMGVVTSITKSKAATAEEAGACQVDSVIVAVTYDSKGIIEKCVIDEAQTKVEFTQEGEIKTELNTEQKTKSELGDEYDMKSSSNIKKEWYEQAKAFAEWTIGKTLDEVKGMKVKKVDDSHPAVPDVPELTSSVSISVGGFIEAIEKAFSSEGSEFDDVDSYKTGLGIITSIAKSKSVDADAEGLMQVDTAIVITTLDSDSKILACVMDSAQTKVNFNDQGEITTDLTSSIRTKTELGEDYGMKKYSAIGKEWYEQINAYSDWTIGKTVDEVKGMNIKAVDEDHPAVPDIPELTATVSISIGDYIEGVEKAASVAQ